MSLSAYVLHHLLTLISFPSYSSPSVTPTCSAICQHVYTAQWSRYLQTAPTKANKQKEHSTVTMPGQLLGGRLAWVYELFFPLVRRLTSFPSCEVRYSHSAENYSIFHASISGAILYQFFSWSPLLNGQIPKLHFTSAVTVTCSDSQDLPGIMWVLQTYEVALGHSYCCSRAHIISSLTKSPSHLLHTHLWYLIERYLSSSSFPWSH